MRQRVAKSEIIQQHPGNYQTVWVSGRFNVNLHSFVILPVKHGALWNGALLVVTVNGVRLFPPFLHLHQSFNAPKGPSALTPQVLTVWAGWCVSFMRHRFPPSEAAISDMVRNAWS